MSKTVTENGVSIQLGEDHSNPTKCKIFYNPVMQVNRELVLSCLSTYSSSTEPVLCLDAFAASGVAGLQWKHHLKDKVIVTLNELKLEAVSGIHDNCKTNGITVSSAPTHAPRGERPTLNSQAADHIEVLQADANVTMHQRQFHFIHLDPFGCTSPFMDAAFRNVYNKGVVVLTCTDVAALFGKEVGVLLRNYDAYLERTDHMREMAARVVIAAAVRSAAKSNKGIEVLYSIAVEHFVQVAVRIHRGATHADRGRSMIRKVLHCGVCHQWAVYPNTKAPIERPYCLLPCDCVVMSQGGIGVEMGPMWCGPIFDTDFVSGMLESANHMKLSDKVKTLLKTVHIESICATMSPDQETENSKQQNGEPESKRLKLDKDSKEEAHTENGGGEKKEMPNRRNSLQLRHIKNDIPMFFFCQSKNTAVPGVSNPSMIQLVSLLQKEGFRASRTHFAPQGVRTNATLQQLKHLLMSNAKKDEPKGDECKDEAAQVEKNSPSEEKTETEVKDS